MNLATNYLGLPLKNPFMPGASPLVDDLDLVRRLEDAGAAAIIMHSLFEEQITLENRACAHHVERHENSFSEALDFLNEPDDFALTSDQYLGQLRRIKEAVSVPVIASLNGTTAGGWMSYARSMERAGADAIELNYYDLPFDPTQTSNAVETDALKILPFFRPVATATALTPRPPGG